jgi:hypothetical protein
MDKGVELICVLKTPKLYKASVGRTCRSASPKVHQAEALHGF